MSDCSQLLEYLSFNSKSSYNINEVCLSYKQSSDCQYSGILFIPDI